MKPNKIISSFSILLALCCSSCSTPQILTPDYATKEYKNIEHYFHGTNEVSIHTVASTIKGEFKVLKSSNYIDITRCSFKYTKGLGLTDIEETYKFQQINILVSGKDQQGVDAFERFVYSNADLLPSFKVWDYTQSFGPTRLDESLKFGFDNKNSIMTFIKKEKNTEFIFNHTDIFGIRKSKFYKEGEKRDYQIILFFNKFNDQQVKLNQINIKVQSSLDLGVGKFTEPKDVMNAECTNFE